MPSVKSKKLNIAYVGVLLLLIAGSYFGVQYFLSPDRKPVDRNAEPLEAERITFRDQSFDVVKVDPSAFETRLFWKDDEGNPYRNFESLEESLAKDGRKLRFATNAGIFSVDHTPGGLHIEDGQVLKNLNLRDGSGNFHMKPNGVFLLGAEGAGVFESEQFRQEDLHPQLATQSGPMLVIDNQLHPDFREGSSNRYIRNGVGVDQEGNIYFAISNQRVNFFDFASLFRDRLGCPDALYLDGSISAFYLPELGRDDIGSDFCGILAIVE